MSAITKRELPASIKRRRPGRPAFVATPEQRDLVKELAGLGVRQADICRFVQFEGGPVGLTTLKAHFDDELALGHIEASAKVAHSLFQLAIGGNVSACIFWLKTRMGWRETTVHEVTGPDGEPLAAPVPPSFTIMFEASHTMPAGQGEGD